MSYFPYSRHARGGRFYLPFSFSFFAIEPYHKCIYVTMDGVGSQNFYIRAFVSEILVVLHRTYSIYLLHGHIHTFRHDQNNSNNTTAHVAPPQSTDTKQNSSIHYALFTKFLVCVCCASLCSKTKQTSHLSGLVISLHRTVVACHCRCIYRRTVGFIDENAVHILNGFRHYSTTCIDFILNKMTKYIYE